jgi:hypothetical protein
MVIDDKNVRHDRTLPRCPPAPAPLAAEASSSIARAGRRFFAVSTSGQYDHNRAELAKRPEYAHF